jgi:hypothetical protein
MEVGGHIRALALRFSAENLFSASSAAVTAPCTGEYVAIKSGRALPRSPTPARSGPTTFPATGEVISGSSCPTFGSRNSECGAVPDR